MGGALRSAGGRPPAAAACAGRQEAGAHPRGAPGSGPALPRHSIPVWGWRVSHCPGPTGLEPSPRTAVRPSQASLDLQSQALLLGPSACDLILGIPCHSKSAPWSLDTTLGPQHIPPPSCCGHCHATSQESGLGVRTVPGPCDCPSFPLSLMPARPARPAPTSVHRFPQPRRAPRHPESAPPSQQCPGRSP